MRLPVIRLFVFISVLAAFVGAPSVISTSGPQSQPPAGQAQQPAALAQEPNLTLVSVDFRVMARDGKPVLDLKPEEVTLKIGSRARDIVALELIKAGGDTPPLPKGATPPPPAPPPPFLTNAPIVGGRSVTLLVDDEVIEPGHEEPVRDALRQLVEALTPDDHVGLSTVRGGVVTHPTVRHDRVLTDIAALKGREGMGTAADAATTAVSASGRGSSSTMSPTTLGTDPTCRTRMVHDALMNQFESVVASVPTVIVLVSTGLAAPTTSSMSNMSTGSGQTGACEFSAGDLSTLTSAAALSRAHVYGLEPLRGVDVSVGFENFANLTGNARVRLSGDTKPAMTRIANETLAYYVAAFEVTDQERNGSSQRVAVTVARPGVEVKPQPTVVIPKPAAPGAKTNRPKVRDLLSAGKTYRDLPLRATVHTSRASPDGKLRVVCVFDSSDPEAKIAEAGAVLFDTTGKARVQWTAQPADLKGAPVVAAFTAPGPGTYRMRLAAVDASGEAGTINEDVRVAAPSPGAPLVSALVLGTKAASGFAPRLQFVDEQVAIAMVEVFGVSKATNVEAKFEFAAFEDGPALGTLAGVVQTPPNHDDTRMAFVSFPIEQMPAGDFVVRAVIGVDGQPLEVKPAHTLRKVER
jgi:hypothetical protein